MYDTVNLKLEAVKVGGVSFIDEIPYYLTDVGFHEYNGVQSITGNLNSLKVYASSWQIKVKDSSICKWYLGDNYKTIGRGDMQRAIERMSDELHLPMNLATVTRFDVGCNVITQHPADVYFNHLGEMKWAKRLVQPDGLYYKKTNECICFYDKNKEQKVRGVKTPEIYKDRNVLRYEQRYLKRAPSILGVTEITGASLYDERFYITVLNRWLEAYKSISKINDIQLNFNAMKTKQQLYRQGILSLIERAGGELAFLAQISEAQKRGELTPKQAYDLREAVKQACQEQEGLTIKSDAISELDKKIYEAIRYYR